MSNLEENGENALSNGQEKATNGGALIIAIWILSAILVVIAVWAAIFVEW